MESVLCNRGYVITKNMFSDNEIYKIKKDLTVKPYIKGVRGRFVKSFKVYLENKKKLCIPKFYGIQNLGKPKLIDIYEGDDIDLKFNGSLRDYQLKLIEEKIPLIKDQQGGTISLPPGRGKTVIACNIISRLNFNIE